MVGLGRFAFTVSATTLFVLGGNALAVAADVPGQVPDSGVGTVYAMSNSLTGNEVLAYARADNGTLSSPTRVSTGGLGSGSFENSNAALIVASPEGQSSPVNLGGGNNLVYAVNAGSDSISVFGVTDAGLELLEVEPSGGERPTSLTLQGGRLFVLNSAGDTGGAGLCLGGHPNISGFTVAEDGLLDPIPDSTRVLPGGITSGCAQVSFTPAGDQLIVTEIAADDILAYPIDGDGVVATEPTINTPTGTGPFGLTFDLDGRMLVTENGQAAPEAGTVASYELGTEGTVSPLSGSISNSETDPCWIVVTPDGTYAYVTNFGPNPLLTVTDPAVRRGTISSFALGADGTVELLEGQAAQLGVGAADLALGGNGRFLYALNTVEGAVSGFQIGEDGSLTLVTAAGGLPTSPLSPLPISMGLATRDAT